MRIELDCPACAGRLRFAPQGTARDGSALTTCCPGCGSPFRLWGGRLVLLGPSTDAGRHRRVG